MVPRDAIVFSGPAPRQLRGPRDAMVPEVSCYPDASDGLIHFRNTLTLPTITLTLDSDPVILESISQDARGVLHPRGGPRIGRRAGGLSLARGGDAGGGLDRRRRKDRWTIEDYWKPKDGRRSPATSPRCRSTTLTVTPDDPAGGVGDHHVLERPGGGGRGPMTPTATGITFQEQRFITANTVKAAGDPRDAHGRHRRTTIRDTPATRSGGSQG